MKKNKKNTYKKKIHTRTASGAGAVEGAYIYVYDATNTYHSSDIALIGHCTPIEIGTV